MWLLTVLRCQRNQFAEKKTGKEDPLRSPSGRFEFFLQFSRKWKLQRNRGDRKGTSGVSHLRRAKRVVLELIKGPRINAISANHPRDLLLRLQFVSVWRNLNSRSVTAKKGQKIILFLNLIPLHTRLKQGLSFNAQTSFWFLYPAQESRCCPKTALFIWTTALLSQSSWNYRAARKLGRESLSSLFQLRPFSPVFCPICFSYFFADYEGKQKLFSLFLFASSSYSIENGHLRWIATIFQFKGAINYRWQIHLGWWMSIY